MLLLLYRTLLHLLRPDLPLLAAAIAIPVRVAAAATLLLRWLILALLLRLTAALPAAMRIPSATTTVRITAAVIAAMALSLSKTADRQHDNA